MPIWQFHDYLFLKLPAEGNGQQATAGVAGPARRCAATDVAMAAERGQWLDGPRPNRLEVPDQVNAMIEGFLRHYV